MLLSIPTGNKLPRLYRIYVLQPAVTAARITWSLANNGYNLTQILEIVPVCRTEAGWKLENIGTPAARSRYTRVRMYTCAWIAVRGVIKVVNFTLARIWIRFRVCSPARNDGTSENKVTSYCFKEQEGRATLACAGIAIIICHVILGQLGGTC